MHFLRKKIIGVKNVFNGANKLLAYKNFGVKNTFFGVNNIKNLA